MTKTFVVVEPGSTHQGQLSRMIEMIDIAQSVGADCVKFQWTSDAAKMCEMRGAEPEKYLESYRLLEFDHRRHRDLQKLCQWKGLKYACTTYLPEDEAVVAPHVDYLKIASFENDRIREQYVMDKPLLVSTGMMPMNDIIALASGLKSDDVLFSCVSAYPCPAREARLATVRELAIMKAKMGWTFQVGSSDHTLHAMSGAVAVAAGATAVEFHLRHPACPRENLDYHVSKTVEAAREYIVNIRQAELLLGEPRGNEPLDVEAPMRAYKARY